jgi:DNA-binding Xre family transcriptional regulator
MRIKVIESGYKQYQIAGLTSIAPTTIAEYCLSQSEIPTHHMVRLCEFFSCEPSDLIGIVESDKYNDPYLTKLMEKQGVSIAGD